MENDECRKVNDEWKKSIVFNSSFIIPHSSFSITSLLFHLPELSHARGDSSKLGAGAASLVRGGDIQHRGRPARTRAPKRLSSC
jgi:hypothetical protein